MEIQFPEQFADCIFESRFFLTESPDIIETDLPIIFNTWTESCASKKCKTASPSDLAVKARKFLERQIRLCQNYEQDLLHKDQAIVEMKHRAIEKEQALIEIKHLMVNKESELAEKNIEILLAKKEMEKIRNTRSWKILSALYNLRKKIGLTS